MIAIGDTPETDALLVKISRSQNTAVDDYEELAVHACKLERQRNELLEALELLMPQQPGHFCDNPHENYDRAVWENARDAIAKATGKAES